MLTLSRKIQHGGTSPTIAIAERARRMQDSGINVAILTAGEPDFPTPRHIKEAAIKAIEQNVTKYTAIQGSLDLRHAIAKKFSLENNLHFEPTQILVSTGAKQSVFNALQAICNKGDEVILIGPHCPDYPEMVRLVDAVPVVVRTSITHNFTPNVRALRRAVNQKTKAMLINSPNNPSGAVYSTSLMEEIAAIAKDAGVYIISDEVYEKFIYDDGARHFSIGSLKSVRDQVITVNGVSMAFSMSGWRIGYMGGPSAVVDTAARVQSQITSNANSIAQHAAISGFNGGTNELDAMREQFKCRRDFVVDFLSTVRDVTITPSAGTFFVFFGVSALYGRKSGDQRIKNSEDLAFYLLEHHHVATGPGSVFGDDTCLRISYACSMSELERGMQRLKCGLEQLR
jgi:aspartate aminotransferase